MSVSNLNQNAKQPKKKLGGTTYENILQGNPINTLTSTNKKQYQTNKTGTVAILEKAGITIEVSNPVDMVLDAQTYRVLDVLRIALTKSFPYGSKATIEDIDKHREVTLSLTDYMTLCELKDRKTAQAQLEKAITTLYNVNLKWTETRKHKEGKKLITNNIEYNARLADAMIVSSSTDDAKPHILTKGKVAFKFSMDIAKYFATHSKVMPYPMNALKINLKNNPHSYFLAKKLAELHNMNKGKATEGVVNVETLLQWLPELPKYEELGEALQVDKRIISPLTRDLDALVDTYGILESWEYCNPKNQPLTEAQLKGMTFEQYQKLNIKYVMKPAPTIED